MSAKYGNQRPCPRCGGQIDFRTGCCMDCGAVPTASYQPQTRGKDTPGLGVKQLVRSMVYGALLTLAVLIFLDVLALRALSINHWMPSILGIDADGLMDFFGAWYSLVIAIVLVLIPLLLLIFSNTQRLRRAVGAIGLSAFITAGICALSSLLTPVVIQIFPDEWQDAFVNSRVVFVVFPAICAAVLAVLGTILVAGYTVSVLFKGGKYEKKRNRITVILCAVILLLVIFAVLWVFIFAPTPVEQEPELPEVEEIDFSELAEESEVIDFEEDEGVLYVNNELVVFISMDAAPEEVESLFDRLEATVDESMADLGIYRLIFDEARSYKEFEDLLAEVKSEPIVDDAYLNLVVPSSPDATGDDDFAYEDAVYPDDPWDETEWDVDTPRGDNWGMEAIDAPGAWGYLDRLNTVRIGLIDSVPETGHRDFASFESSILYADPDTHEVVVNKYTMAADDHGTHVAGIMNADWDNGIGVCGVMGGKGELYYAAMYYDAEDYVYSDYGTSFSYLQELRTLIDQDVQVINISQNTSRLVGFAASHGNEAAINYLTQQAQMTQMGLLRVISERQASGRPDFVICVAAGNSNNTRYYLDEDEPYGYREDAADGDEESEVGGSLAQYNNFLNLMDAEEVKDRVIVVGALGIDPWASTSRRTRYAYQSYSNVGDRIDVVAPGTDVFSCYVDDGYGYMSGTSMATPHVSGVCGLIFAANPRLTGPQVKQILMASTTGRYQHGDSFSGMVNANLAVVNALRTVDTSVTTVLPATALDLCFVVDTTASMGEDIDNAKENMAAILENLATKTSDYRVALVDYRDFAERTEDPDDYPSKVQLPFSSDNEAINNAIQSLDLGYGGDSEETIYSALMEAVSLDWREGATKVIIILGDAPPLDPEPNTGYTYDDVLEAMSRAGISIDASTVEAPSADSVKVSGVDATDAVGDKDEEEAEDEEEEKEEPSDSPISIFSIGTSASQEAKTFFELIAAATGGSYASVDDPSQVAGAIIGSIQQIDMDEGVTVRVDFGEEMANQKVDLYDADDEYLFTFLTDEDGCATLTNMEPATYRWTSSGLYWGGYIDVEWDTEAATVRKTEAYWFTPLVKFWRANTLLICIVLVLCTAICVVVPVTIRRSRKFRAKEAYEKQPVRTCPLCATVLPHGELHCDNCGFDLPY